MILYPLRPSCLNTRRLEDFMNPVLCPFCAAPLETPNAVQVVCRTPDCVLGGFFLSLDGWNTRASPVASMTVAPLGDDFPDLRFVSDQVLRGVGL